MWRSVCVVCVVFAIYDDDEPLSQVLSVGCKPRTNGLLNQFLTQCHSEVYSNGTNARVSYTGQNRLLKFRPAQAQIVETVQLYEFDFPGFP